MESRCCRSPDRAGGPAEVKQVVLLGQVVSELGCGVVSKNKQYIWHYKEIPVWLKKENSGVVKMEGWEQLCRFLMEEMLVAV